MLQWNRIIYRKGEKMQTPQATLVPRFLFEFTWVSFELHIIWANIDKRFNTNYVSVLSSSLLGRVWGCQKHSRIRAECLHLTTQDKIPLLAYVEGKVTTIKRCLTNVLFVLNVHTILYVHSIYLKNNHYAIEPINSIDFLLNVFVLFEFDFYFSIFYELHQQLAVICFDCYIYYLLFD